MDTIMPYVIGAVLAVVVALFARWVGLDRDGAFYPTVLIVVALYYVLFAAMSGSIATVAAESVVMSGFAIAAAVGFRLSPWVTVLGLAGHGVLDAGHHLVITNTGVPEWWPAFCLAYDVTAAGALALLVRRARGAGLD